ncbi:hypothetical protein CDAR_302151 [Caerostris darwini]|uniref:Uncharacterized protein n=1 Tax=Caerostris darwini TaxID=1538125 RepID=A0AAV4SHB2_9ARAC|nr:hypothetical protein CDAR_302151 [Caerostris darwini]
MGKIFPLVKFSQNLCDRSPIDRDKNSQPTKNGGRAELSHHGLQSGNAESPSEIRQSVAADTKSNHKYRVEVSVTLVSGTTGCLGQLVMVLNRNVKSGGQTRTLF